MAYRALPQDRYRRSTSSRHFQPKVVYGLTSELVFESRWQPVDKAMIEKLDDHTIVVKGHFGSFVANGTEFHAEDAYFFRPSAHLYAGASMVMEMHIPGHSANGTSATIVIFFEVQDDPEYDTFSYTVGFGTEDIKSMSVADTKSNYDRIDMNLAVPPTQKGSEFLHYHGSSLLGKCEKTWYLVSKITIIINAKQLYELVEKPSNYEINPIKIIVNDGAKPDKPDTPEPDHDDDLKFDDILYKNNYGPYPPIKGDKPPQDFKEYPNPNFPYPDTWGWIGEPNYPNDPWYPYFVFPPEQPIKRPQQNEIPPVVTYETVYNDPIYPDQSPNWPYGYPIWPDLSYPVWPQNADFYPDMSEPYPDTSKPPVVNQQGNTPVAPFPFKVHPMYPFPYYTYFFPITYYPQFPVEHYPDDVFNPKLYPGYPVFPNDNPPQSTPQNPEKPNDPKLRWPQNPYYSWPEVPGFKWPQTNRFIWPQDPSDPHWMWPSEPLKDPKWRRPQNLENLPPSIGQRRPDLPFQPNKPIPTHQNPEGLQPTNTSTIPRHSIPPVEESPQPRPGYSHPDPNQIITMPHARPPFPVDDADLPCVYRGVPNQPLGLLPTLAIPVWKKPNPKIYAIAKRPPPKAPTDLKWIPYFYYPLPHRTKKTNRIGLTPQYILVDKDLNPPVVEPTSIPVYISKPPAPNSKPSKPSKPSLILYNMPVVHKPVDPALKMKIRANDDQKRSVQAKLDKNKDIDQKNIKYLSMPPKVNNPTNLPKVTNTTNIVNRRTVPSPGHPAPPSKPNNISTTTVNEMKMTPPPPPPKVHYPPIKPSSPNSTVVYDDSTGMPLREITGYDTVCDKWEVSVLVNRHFKHAFEWRHSDMELSHEGANRVCVSWKKVPRFKEIDAERMKKYFQQNGLNVATMNSTKGGKLTEAEKKRQDQLAKLKANPDINISVPTVNINKIRIEVPCDNHLDVVLNDRNMNEATKEVTDTVGKKCHIWVNSQQEAQDYKQRNSEMAKRQKLSTVKQLAYMRMVPLSYDE